MLPHVYTQRPRILILSNFQKLKNVAKMAMAQQAKFKLKLPPEGKTLSFAWFYWISVNRILYVRNLPYKITTEEIYDIFGKFGALRQVRLGINPDTKGTAYVVYEVKFDFMASS